MQAAVGVGLNIMRQHLPWARKQMTPASKAGAVRRWQGCGASGARLDEPQGLLDVLDTWQRNAQGPRDLRARLAGLHKPLHACAGRIRDDGAPAALRLPSRYNQSERPRD